MIDLILSVALSDEDVAALHEYGEKRFQAGLKRAAEICGMAQGPSGGIIKEYRGKTAKVLEQAILKELSEDHSPSVFPED